MADTARYGGVGEIFRLVIFWLLGLEPATSPKAFLRRSSPKMNIQQGGLRGLLSRRMSAPQIVVIDQDDDSTTDDEADEHADHAAAKNAAARFPPPRRPALDRRLSVPHSMGYARRDSASSDLTFPDQPGRKELSAREKRHLEERAQESSDFLARLRQLRVAPQDAAVQQQQRTPRRASMSPQRTDVPGWQQTRRASSSPQRNDVPRQLRVAPQDAAKQQQPPRRASNSPQRRDVPANLTNSMVTVKLSNVKGNKARDDSSLQLSESSRSASKKSLDMDIMRQVFSEEEEEEEEPDEQDRRRTWTGASNRPSHPYHSGPRSPRRASAESTDSSVNQTIMASQQVTIDRLLTEKRQHESLRTLLEKKIADLTESLQLSRMREKALEEALERRPSKSDEMKVLEDQNRVLSSENEELRQRLTLASELDDIGEMRKSIIEMRRSLRPLSEFDVEDIEASGRTSDYSSVRLDGLMESFQSRGSAASSSAAGSLGESSLGGESDGAHHP